MIEAPEKIWAYGDVDGHWWDAPPNEGSGAGGRTYILEAEHGRVKAQRDDALDLLRRVVEERNDVLVGPDQVPHPTWLKEVRDLFKDALTPAGVARGGPTDGDKTCAMPEHPEAPDRIWVPLRDVASLHAIPANAIVKGPGPYFLRETPARLAAEQMLEALRLGLIWLNTQHPTNNAVKHTLEHTKAEFRAAIAAAQGEENG